MSIGYLHQDPDCHYLKRCRGNRRSGRIVEFAGEMLDLLGWCSKCSPGRSDRSKGVSVEYDASPRISGTMAVPLLVGRSTPHEAEKPTEAKTR